MDLRSFSLCSKFLKKVQLFIFHLVFFGLLSHFWFDTSCSPEAETSIPTLNNVFSYLQRHSDTNVSLRSESIHPIEECINPITLVVGILHRLHIHVNSRSKVMDLWHPIHMVLRRVASHLSIRVPIRIHNSEPHHYILPSLQMREVSHIDIDDCGRLV
jgi:hypothetical protein